MDREESIETSLQLTKIKYDDVSYQNTLSCTSKEWSKQTFNLILCDSLYLSSSFSTYRFLRVLQVQPLALAHSCRWVSTNICQSKGWSRGGMLLPCTHIHIPATFKYSRSRLKRKNGIKWNQIGLGREARGWYRRLLIERRNKNRRKTVEELIKMSYNDGAFEFEMFPYPFLTLASEWLITQSSTSVSQ